ncbi:hypothetical protein C477_09099 [Haloterrigena salina JCM 13891]|uniref:Sulfatase n=1 Tax=Haloterrigena salina JCM 13891 TaxID=1227488 RepID=M0C7A3_9EURY|nr:hypothetical protein [Haloterrigena salina]ELZ19146.1 hypothetical protein C477_09099 [Haloterrigena salina JCM 13891]
MSGLRRRIEDVIAELRANWRSDAWWAERIRTRVNSPVQRLLRSRENTLNYLEEDWNVLVVLDACRADLFENVVDEDYFDDVTTVRSPATETKEWLNRTFDGTFGDIVYVAGNPMVSNVKPGAFHDLIEVWRDAWDEESGVLRPEPITEAARTALREHPNKRVIVHYMQPHAPFIDYPELNFSGDADVWGLEVSEAHPNFDAGDDYNNPWEALEAGAIDAADVWEAYEHNLEIVMDEVAALLESTDRRVVVTSDHGNAFGERSWPIPVRLFGHPGHRRHSALTDVPWAVVDGKRRGINTSDVSSETEATEREVKEHLAALGYAEE